MASALAVFDRSPVGGHDGSRNESRLDESLCTVYRPPTRFRGILHDARFDDPRNSCATPRQAESTAVRRLARKLDAILARARACLVELQFLVL